MSTRTTDTRAADDSHPPVTITAQQDRLTGAWHLHDADGERIGSVRHRYLVEANARRIASVLAPGADVQITYRSARKGRMKRMRES